MLNTIRPQRIQMHVFAFNEVFMRCLHATNVVKRFSDINKISLFSNNTRKITLIFMFQFKFDLLLLKPSTCLNVQNRFRLSCCRLHKALMQEFSGHLQGVGWSLSLDFSESRIRAVCLSCIPRCHCTASMIRLWYLHSPRNGGFHNSCERLFCCCHSCCVACVFIIQSI